jgi:hypothetical protein
MRAPRHAAIAVMALTASTYVAAQDVGRFNPDTPGDVYSPDAARCKVWIGVAHASNARRTYWAMVIGGD